MLLKSERLMREGKVCAYCANYDCYDCTVSRYWFIPLY